MKKRAVRIMTNSKYNSHTEPLFKELKLLKISDIFKIQCMKFWYKFKARYGGSNMKKINNGCRLLILYMMEDIKKVNFKNVFLWLFSVTDPLKIQNGRQI